MVTPRLFGYLQTGRPLWFRGLTLSIALLQAITVGPIAWAAPALNSEGFRIAPAVPPPAKGPEPDPELLARQQSLITGLKPPPPAPKREIVQRKGSKDAKAPARFTGSMIKNMGILSADSVPVGKSSENDDTKIGRALFDLRFTKDGERIAALRRVADGNPKSPWRAAVLATLGRLESDKGYFTRSVGHLSEAWKAVRNGKEPLEQVMASGIAGDLALVLARTSRDAEYTELAKEIGDSKGYGTAYQKLVDARNLVSKREKGIANLEGGCAVDALQAWYTALNPRKRLPKVLAEPKERQDRGIEPRANVATSLNELATIAKAAGWETNKAKRGASGQIPVPSILHWKHGHFALVLARNGQNYLVDDRTLGGRVTMTEEALNEETSGYLLAFGTELPSGVSSVRNDEAESVRGFTGGGGGTIPSSTADEDDDPYDDYPPKNPPDPPYYPPYYPPYEPEKKKKKKCPCGMPVYWIDELEGTVKLVDTPLFDDPGVGPALQFSLKYANRQEYRLQNSITELMHVGNLWSLQLLSAVVPEGGGWAVQGDPPWFSGTYSEQNTVILPGGGRETYGTGYNATWPGGISTLPDGNEAMFETHFETHATLHETVIQNGLDDSITTKFERSVANGTKYFYELDVTYLRYGIQTSRGGPFFLTRIQYPNGQEITFNYEYDFGEYGYPFRLASITGPSGNSLTFLYDDTRDQKWLTSVYANNRGQTYSATLTYSDAGQLIGIQDAIGLQSTFEYDGTSDFIQSMHTPYGTTHFAAGNSGTGYFVEVTDPVGGTERVETIHDPLNLVPDTDPNPPSGMAVRNESLNKRNSYYWSKRAMQAIHSMRDDGTLQPGAVDYSLAHITHWLIDSSNGKLVRVPHSTKAPLEGRVWFEYLGQSPNGTTPPTDDFVGTASTPIKVGRVLDDETTQLRQFSHADDGRLLESIDPIGRTTRYSWDNATDKRLTAIKQVNGANEETLALFSSFHLSRMPQTVTDAAGQITTYTYDNDGHVLTMTKTRGGTPETWTMVYYPSNAGLGSKQRLHTISGPGGALLQTFTYDILGRVASITDSDGYVMTATYDAFDRPLSINYPDGTYEQVIYNRLNAEWERDRQGRWTRIEYTPIQRVAAITDPAGRKTLLEWCDCASLESFTDARNQVTTFLYDVQGRLTGRIYADNITLTYAYETRTSRLKETHQPRTETLTAVCNYEYYPDDTLKRLRYTDAVGTPLEQTRADGTKIDASVEWTYDPIYRRVKTMTDGTGTTTYHYVPVGPGNLGAGNIEFVDGPLANDGIGYGHDAYGRINQKTLDAASTSEIRQFDGLGRVSSESNELGNFSYTYAGNTGRLTEVINGQGYRSVYEYYPNVAPAGTGNGNQRLKAIKHYRSTNILSSQHDYAYSPAGNITQWKQRWADLTAGIDYALRYDAADQLIGADSYNTATTNLDRQEAWSYDPVGNRELVQASVRDGQGNYSVQLTRASHNNLNQVTSRTGASGLTRFEGTVNELATVTVGGQRASVRQNPSGPGYLWSAEKTLQAGPNTVSIVATDASNTVTTKTANVSTTGTAIPALSYDKMGNLLNDGTRAYTWDANNQVVQINYIGQGQARSEITYDGLGRKVRITERNSAGSLTSTKCFLWEGTALAEERDLAGTVTKRFYAHGVWQNGTSLLYRHDHLASIRETADSNGATLSRVSYDLWGNRAVLNGGSAEPNLAFTGHYFHAPSNLYFTLHRAYNPDLGRWTSRDPIMEGGGINIYGYVRNTPALLTDPLGLVDLNYVPSDEGQKKVYDAYNPDDEITVAAHGGPDDILDSNRNPIPLSTIATDIKGLKKFKKIKKIRLFICQAGVDGSDGTSHADKLAKLLGPGYEVQGPDGYCNVNSAWADIPIARYNKPYISSDPEGKNADRGWNKGDPNRTPIQTP
jgi:RHS repeat-associated protein